MKRIRVLKPYIPFARVVRPVTIRPEGGLMTRLASGRDVAEAAHRNVVGAS